MEERILKQVMTSFYVEQKIGIQRSDQCSFQLLFVNAHAEF